MILARTPRLDRRMAIRIESVLSECQAEVGDGGTCGVGDLAYPEPPDAVVRTSG